MDTIKSLILLLRCIQNFQGRQKTSSVCVETLNYGAFQLVTRGGKPKSKDSEMLILQRLGHVTRKFQVTLVDLNSHFYNLFYFLCIFFNNQKVFQFKPSAKL